MKNGCCMACGYEKGRNEKPEGGSVCSGNGALDNGRIESLQTPKKTNHTGALIGICIGAALFILIFCLAVYLIVNDLGSRAENGKGLSKAVSDERDGTFAEEERKQEDSFAGEDEPDPDGSYVPDAQDEYYVTIVDSLRGDLDYSVEWLDDEIVSEDRKSSLYTFYPQLAGDIPHLDDLNEKIEEMGHTGESLFEFAKESEGTFDFYVHNDGYVTYMDENTVSIVFLVYVGIGDSMEYFPRIMDLNIDLKTGRILSHEEMVDYSDALTEKVYSQNQYQNSTDLAEFGWTNAYIGELLQGYDGVAFYTPVGLEVGFNYEDEESGTVGWLTVTIKETEKYGKREWP